MKEIAMERKNLYLVDTYSTCCFHEMFNAGLLAICTKEVEEIVYCASRSSQKRVLTLLKKNGYGERVSCKPLCVIHRETGLGALLRIIVSAFQNIFCMLKGGKTPILFMHNDALSVGWLSLLSVLLKRPLWIVCHGELELLLEHPKWFKPSFWFKLLFQLFFRYFPLSSRMRFIVLGESIRKNLVEYLPSRAKKLFVAIPHPYFFERREEVHEFRDVLTLGTVGCMNMSKGYQRLVMLSKLLMEAIKKQKVSISIIGRLENVRMEKGVLLHLVSKNNEMLPREKFENEISKLDYILFLYDMDAYKLTASGAIFDAINMEKPVLALRNDFFVSVFESCGEMGYLFSTVEEMCDKIEHLQRYPAIDEYNKFIFNMRKAKNIFAPENIHLNLCS